MDGYRRELKKAGWTWLEDGGNPRRKDRTESRTVKRRARREARRDVERQAAGESDVHPRELARLRLEPE